MNVNQPVAGTLLRAGVEFESSSQVSVDVMYTVTQDNKVVYYRARPLSINLYNSSHPDHPTKASHTPNKVGTHMLL